LYFEQFIPCNKIALPAGDFCIHLCRENGEKGSLFAPLRSLYILYLSKSLSLGI